MPLHAYGVLKGRPLRRRLAKNNATYYQFLLEAGERWRVAINVASAVSPIELLYFVDEDFRHPIVSLLPALPPGFTALARKPGGVALDYIRYNLVNFDRLRPWPFSSKGRDNDLNEKIDRHIERAILDQESTVYVWGEPWGPEHNRRDSVFRFLPGRGMHDIHMNQGNVGRFTHTDGVWQDGGVMIHFHREDQWVAMLFAFQPQTRHTDDETGRRIETQPANGELRLDVSPGLPFEQHGFVRIVAAQLFIEGSDCDCRTVTLLNTTPRHIDLGQWALFDHHGNKLPLDGEIRAGTARTVAIPDTMVFPEKGGTLLLVDSQGLKVDGAAYTAKQAARRGWTIVFRN
jgi:uncharacterized protein YukJ